MQKKIENKERYCERLALIDGNDLHVIPREKWMDNVDFWPAITYIHIRLYLLFTPSPYTRKDLQNYNSYIWLTLCWLG